MQFKIRGLSIVRHIGAEYNDLDKIFPYRVTQGQWD